MHDLPAILASLALGLYAGSLLTEGMILVPYWRRMAASDFLSLHGSLGPSLFRYYAPVTTAAFVLSVTAAAIGTVLFSWQTLAALFCSAALLTFFLYFQRANASFADHSLDESDLPNELAKWSAWHWARTVMVVSAFVASILALTAPMS
jgi:hypothetical protein